MKKILETTRAEARYIVGGTTLEYIHERGYRIIRNSDLEGSKFAEDITLQDKLDAAAKANADAEKETKAKKEKKEAKAAQTKAKKEKKEAKTAKTKADKAKADKTKAKADKAKK